MSNGTDYRYMLDRPGRESWLCLQERNGSIKSNIYINLDQSVNSDDTKYTFIG